MHTLTRGEQKSLAYHYAVADKLRVDPALLATARRRLQWYRERNPQGRRYYERWRQLLTGPLEQLLAAMTDESAAGCALRQENPFVDLISQRERAEIYRQVVARVDAILP
jgi:hypothetical protein